MPTEKPVETAPADDFANAFLEAIKEDAPDVATVPAAAPAPAAKPADTAAAAVVDPAESPVEGAAESEKTAETDEKVVETTEKAVEEESPEAKIARLEAENAALRAPKPAPAAPEKAPETTETTVETAEKAPKTAEKPVETAPVEPKWYEFGADEKTVVEAFKKDWPDIAAANELLLKQATYNAVEYVFDVLRRQVLPKLKSFEELSDVFAERLTLDELRQAHQDYDKIYPDVVAWVETLPAAFRSGAKQVMQSGSPDEVAELIATYKEAKGTATPSPKVTTELSAAAKQAAGKLRAVGSKRTTPATAPDPNDYDSAWNEAVGGS